MRLVLLMSIISSASLFVSPVGAQQKKFDDMLTQQRHQELTATLTVQQDPDIVKGRAKAIRALYEALLKEGFSKEESLVLVSATLSGRN